MEKEFVEQMKEKLTAQRDQILASLASQSDDMKNLVSPVESGDEADKASDVVDRTMLDSLGAQDANRLQLINNALVRIQRGTYGLCLKCNKEIPKERLEVLPYAFLCINCKNQEERKNR
ncbi:MAG: TraR/DksA family transcriptional regulator [Treponema sp.]|nr:TraR/DksA family transcriptional regulator [Treponema sp.]